MSITKYLPQLPQTNSFYNDQEKKKTWKANE